MGHYDRYMPIEVHTKKATAGEATANKVIFTLPYKPNGVVAQIVKEADNTLYATGQTIEVKEDETTKVVTVEVAATAILANDVVTIIATK